MPSVACNLLELWPSRRQQLPSHKAAATEASPRRPDLRPRLDFVLVFCVYLPKLRLSRLSFQTRKTTAPSPDEGNPGRLTSVPHCGFSRQPGKDTKETHLDEGA